MLSFYSNSQVNFKDLKVVKTNSISCFQFSESFYYNYIINSKNITDSIYTKINISNSPEGLITKKFEEKLKANIEKITNKISLFSKFTFEYNQNTFCVIKFKFIEDSKPSKIQIFISKKENNIWKIYAENNDIIHKFKSVLFLKENAFAQFEMNEKNDKYLEINKLKPLVKDADGILNIYKLGEIIEKNKASLSKYLDE